MLLQRFVILAIIVSASAFAFGQDVAKLPIPDEEAQTAALEIVNEVYKAGYEAARSNEQKAALAKKMVQDSAATKDAINLYVLLRVAKDIAAEAGDVDTSFVAISELSKGNEVDVLMLKAAAIAKASNELRLPKDHQALAPRFIALVEQALAEDRYELANKIAEVALKSARNAKSSEVIKQVVESKKRVEELEATFAEVQAALVVMQERPSDPDANLVVGKFRCFVKDKWDAGIPMLAFGKDKKLKASAIQELSNPADFLAIGDSWWEVAEGYEDGIKAAIRLHASGFYKTALPKLTGLQKAKVETRLDSVANLITNKGPSDTVKVEVGIPPLPREPLLVLTFHPSTLTKRNGQMFVQDAINQKSLFATSKTSASDNGVGGSLEFREGFIALPGPLMRNRSQYTFLCWFNAEQSDKPYRLYTEYSSGGVLGAIALMADGSVRLNAWNEDYEPQTTSSSPARHYLNRSTPAGVFKFNNWHFLAVRFQNGGMAGKGTTSVFIDGSRYELDCQKVKYSKTPTVVLGGNGGLGVSRDFVGVLDEVVFFERALSDTEIGGIRDRGVKKKSLTD